MERYKIIQKFKFSEQYLSCPVELCNGALLYDAKEKSLVMQLKMRFLTSNEIRSIDVKISYTDRNGKKDISFTYNTFEKPIRGRFFADNTPILLSTNKADDITVLITNVRYKNGSVWEYSGEQPIFSVGQVDLRMFLKEDLFSQYYVREDKHDFVNLRTMKPIQNEDYWQCACGRANGNQSLSCVRCGINKAWIFQHTDKEYLEGALKAYEDEQRTIKEKAEAEAEEQSRKVKKVIAVAALAIAAVFLLKWFLGYVNIIWSHSVYKKAAKFMEEKQYHEMFEQCYKVAPVPLERTEESKSVEINVIILLENCASNILDDYAAGNISDADAKTYLTIISKYIDDPEILVNYESVETSKSCYSVGLELMKDGDYLLAIKRFNSVIEKDANYSVASQKIEQCKKLLKPDTITKLAQHEEKGSFEEGLELIAEVSKYIKNDADIEGYRDRFKYKIEYAELDEYGRNAMSDGVKVSYGTDLHSQPHTDYKTTYYTLDWGRTTILGYRITQEDDSLILWYQVRSEGDIYWIIGRYGYLR